MAEIPEGKPRPAKMVLLEHDERFSVFPEFVFYDFAQPVRLPGMCPHDGYEDVVMGRWMESGCDGDRG